MSEILPWLIVVILLACCLVPAVLMMTRGRGGTPVDGGEREPAARRREPDSHAVRDENRGR